MIRSLGTSPLTFASSTQPVAHPAATRQAGGVSGRLVLVYADTEAGLRSRMPLHRELVGLVQRRYGGNVGFQIMRVKPKQENAARLHTQLPMIFLGSQNGAQVSAVQDIGQFPQYTGEEGNPANDTLLLSVMAQTRQAIDTALGIDAPVNSDGTLITNA